MAARKFRIMLFVVVIVLSLFTAGWWLGWGKSPRGADMERIADELVAPADWSIVTRLVRDRSPLCIDVRCPSVYKRWEFAEPINDEKLASMMKSAGWRDVHVDDDCVPEPNRTGSFPTCFGEATSENARINLTISGPYAGPRPFWAVLIVEER